MVEPSISHDPAPPLTVRGRGFWQRHGKLAWLCRNIRNLAVAYLAVVGVVMFLEEPLVFFPSRYPEGDWHQAGIAIEDAWFQAADGTTLHGWYAPCQDAKAAVLFSHGNGGNITHRIDLLRALHKQVGVSVLMFDYRGYGRSDGKPSEAGILADARAARAWLAKREGIAEGDIVQMGESLGGAVAVDLAAKDGARGLVLQSTFSSLPDVAAFHYPFFPVRWLMRTRLDSCSKIREYRGPLLQCHGDADTIVPFRYGRRLFDAANEPKRFLVIRGHDHNDPLPPDYFDVLAEFIVALPPRAK
jgi:fermentation-respiration switch protein FrsA (DUF1100 family)